MNKLTEIKLRNLIRQELNENAYEINPVAFAKKNKSILGNLRTAVLSVAPSSTPEETVEFIKDLFSNPGIKRYLV